MMGYRKIKKIYSFEHKAMHELSEKSGLSNPLGKILIHRRANTA